MKHTVIGTRLKSALCVLVTIAATACGDSDRVPVAEAGGAGDSAVAVDPTFVDMDPRQIAELVQREDPLLVNVHIPFEGEIAGTDVHIPFDQIETHLDRLPKDKDAPVVLYCRSGRMSRIAAETLTSLGYTKLYHLDGGMNAWQAAGYPLQTTPGAQ